MSSPARQLHLFKSRKQRGQVPPSFPEFSIHVAVADLLRRWALPGVEWTHFPAGEYRTDATAGRLQRMGLRPGWPDFQIFHADGRVCFLELKAKGRKLTKPAKPPPMAGRKQEVRQLRE